MFTVYMNKLRVKIIALSMQMFVKIAGGVCR